MELKEIKELIRLVSDAGVSEVEVERGDFKISIKKTDDKVTYVQSAPAIAQPIYHEAPRTAYAASEVHTERMEAPVAKADSLSGNYITIKSPMIGTYYKSPSPDKPQFIQIGDEIKPGQVLCIVEAMKMANVIRASRKGKLKSVLGKAGDLLVVDQVLVEYEAAPAK
jgi:acetyl-CoA carboxylase biotin carboxyl carrier protein